MTRVLYLEDNDIQAMGQMIDIAVKASGSSLVNNAFVLLTKLGNAEEVETPTDPPVDKDESDNGDNK